MRAEILRQPNTDRKPTTNEFRPSFSGPLEAGAVRLRFQRQEASQHARPPGLLRKCFFVSDTWILLDEIAAHFVRNPVAIYQWITRKRMLAHKLRRLWKFLASEVDQWVKTGLAGTNKSGAETSPKSP